MFHSDHIIEKVHSSFFNLVNPIMLTAAKSSQTILIKSWRQMHNSVKYFIKSFSITKILSKVS